MIRRTTRGRTTLAWAATLTVLVIGTGNFVSGGEAPTPESTPSQTAGTPASAPGSPSVDQNQRPEGGPDYERWFFDNWYAPFGAELPRTKLDEIHGALEAMPKKTSSGVSTWKFVGPSGMPDTGGGKYSGRVLDLDITNSTGLRVAAASGGFFNYINPIGGIHFPIRLTHDLPSQVIGAFSTDPFDEDVIMVGTGEPGIRSGTGLYLTTDGGDTWFSIAMSPEPSGFFRIRHDPDEEHLVYAATTAGFYRSVDRGISWTRTHTGSVSDFVIDPSDTNVIHAVMWGDGYYRSLDYGATWTKITSGLPTTDLGRISIAIAPSLATRLYMAIAKGSDSTMLGIYRSAGSGSSWSSITPSTNYMHNQGDYDNVLTVDPSNPSVVFAGGVTLMKTTDGGATWAEVWDPDLHVDYHAFAWNDDGSEFYAGHDGGVSLSTDRGATWSSGRNILPITQFYHIDTFPTSTSIYGGGTQDNGVPVTLNGGTNWITASGDGGGFAVNPNNAAEMWNTYGAFPGGPFLFKRYHTTDSGANWSEANAGLPASTNWFPQLRHDQSDPGLIFTNVGDGDLGGPGVYESRVYASSNGGVTWSNYWGSQFTSPIDDLTTSTWDFVAGRAVYACLNASTNNNRLWVADGSGGWAERSTGLPTGYRVRRVVPHPTNTHRAYALMNGLGNLGQKVFLTTDRGVSWSNITGNLPDVPVSDLVVTPYDNDTLILGSAFGCFRSDNGGTTWDAWGNGMPKGAIIQDLATIDLTATFSGYWVVAGTYGLSIWKREITDVDDGLFSDDFETGDTSYWAVTST